jgi:hypothetical protein
MSRRLKAFEMWLYRRILKIPWTDRVTNVEVLNRMGKDREILRSIKTRKLQYLDHIMRGHKYSIPQLVSQGKINGKRSRGRRRISWLKIRDWYECSSTELFRVADDKDKIALMVADLR